MNRSMYRGRATGTYFELGKACEMDLTRIAELARQDAG